jgi:sulfate permease, SulP family
VLPADSRNSSQPHDDGPLEGTDAGGMSEQPPPKPRQVSGIAPILTWLPEYDRRWLSKDAIAAASVWALLVPQGVAYASVAGVPPQYGLYAAMFGVLLYAVFGSTRHVVTGPSASVAAVSASAVGAIGAAGAQGSATWVAYTATLAVVVGLLYIALGLLRMGWISNFLSSPVLDGFVLGFGIGLTIDQSHKILGTPKVDGSYLEVLVGTIRSVPDTSITTLAVGATALAVLLGLRRFRPRWPRALIVAILGIAASAAMNLSDHGVSIVGEVPTGLPSLTVPTFAADTIGTLLTGAFAVIIVGFSESLAAARTAAAKHGYDVNASQEMIGQGAANAASGLFGGMSVAGSLSKTTVADLAGQRTQVASIVNGGLILLTILALAGLFTDLPQAVLGAIVIDAAIGLVNIRRARQVFRAGVRDLAAYLAALIGLLTIGVVAGVMIGAALSLLLLVAAASASPVRRLGYLEAEHAFVDRAAYPAAATVDGIVVVDIAGPLFFADANSFRDHVLAAVAAESPHAVVVDMAPVTFLDLDGAEILKRIHTDLTSRGVRMALARVGAGQLDVLRRTGVLTEISEEQVFVSARRAVEALRSSPNETTS